jgi:hypothetical protein
MLAALAPGDAGQVLTLQRAAFVTEARAHRDLHLPPLTQTLADLPAELGEARRPGAFSSQPGCS